MCSTENEAILYPADQNHVTNSEQTLPFVVNKTDSDPAWTGCALKLFPFSKFFARLN